MKGWIKFAADFRSEQSISCINSSNCYKKDIFQGYKRVFVVVFYKNSEISVSELVGNVIGSFDGLITHQPGVT